MVMEVVALELPISTRRQIESGDKAYAHSHDLFGQGQNLHIRLYFCFCPSGRRDPFSSVFVVLVFVGISIRFEIPKH